MLANGRTVERRATGRWRFATTPPIPPRHVRGLRRAVALGDVGARRVCRSAGTPAAPSRAELDRDADELRQITDGVLRPLRVDVRRALRVRLLRPGLRARPELGRAGDPGLRHLPRRVPARRPGHRGRAPTARHGHRPRDGAHVVRRPGDDDAGGRTPGCRSPSPTTWASGSAQDAAGFAGTFVDFTVGRKAGAYAADERRSTHPVAAVAEDVADVDHAANNFDMISYAKGNSVIRQLVTWLGDDDFLAGVNAYLARHRFGNATLADFVDALERRHRPRRARLGRGLAAHDRLRHPPGHPRRRRSRAPPRGQPAAPDPGHDVRRVPGRRWTPSCSTSTTSPCASPTPP